jgi:hypothetical protein
MPDIINTSFKVNPLSIKLPTGNGTIYSNGETVAERWSLDSANKTLYFPDAGDGVFPQIRYSTPGNDGMELFTAAKPIKITVASNTNWTFGTDGRTTFPVATVPAHSYGAAGDKTGMLAFDSTYIYYCFADFNSETTFNVTSEDSGSHNALDITIPYGELPAYVTVGWIVNRVSPVDSRIITGIENYNGFTRLIFDGQSTWDYSFGESFVLTNPGNIAIWKRTAHGTGTW